MIFIANERCNPGCTKTVKNLCGVSDEKAAFPKRLSAMGGLVGYLVGAKCQNAAILSILGDPFGIFKSHLDGYWFPSRCTASNNINPQPVYFTCSATKDAFVAVLWNYLQLNMVTVDSSHGWRC